MNRHNYIIYRGLIIFLLLTSWWIAFSYFSIHYFGHNFSYLFLLFINLSLSISIFVFDIPSMYTYSNRKRLKQQVQTPSYYVKVFNKLILTTRWVYLLYFPLILVIASLVEIVCSFYFVMDLSSLVASARLLHLTWLSTTIITLACFNCLFFVIFSVTLTISFLALILLTSILLKKPKLLVIKILSILTCTCLKNQIMLIRFKLTNYHPYHVLVTYALLFLNSYA